MPSRRRSGDKQHIPIPRSTPNLVGLALSGGGVRSATFALGALQALNERRLLRIFDYLSTVSGGGFTGAWWSAWLARQPRGRVFPDSEDTEASRRPPRLLGDGWELGARPAARVLGVPEGGLPAPDPIHYLRLFANYLTPRTGLVSADTWRAITFYLRSLLFNWLVFLPLFLAAIVAGQLYFVASPGVGTDLVCSAPDRPGAAPADRIVVAAPSSPLCSGYRVEHGDALSRRLHAAALPFVALFIAMAVISLLWLLHATVTPWASLLALVMEAGIVIYLVSALAGAGTKGSPVVILAGVAAGTVLLAHLIDLARVDLVDGAIQHDIFRTHLSQWHTLALAVTIALGLWLTLAGFSHEVVWFLFYPGSGEAWAGLRRAGGWGSVLFGGAAAGWTAFTAAPSSRAKDSAEPQPWLTGVGLRVAPYVVLTILGLFLATAGREIIARLAMPSVVPVLLAGLLAGAFTKMLFALWDRNLATSGWLRLIATVLVAVALYLMRIHQPVLAQVGFVLLLGVLAWQMYVNGQPDTTSRIFAIALPVLAMVDVLVAQRLVVSAASFEGPSAPLYLVALAAILLLVALVISVGWTSDPNLLSMHSFYKARLVRAYLGASNPDRWQNPLPVTGGASGDDVRLSDLWNFTEGAPYHLINTTLNLVASRDLATAQRLAANFVLSKFYCGSSRTGYRFTDEYMGDELTLGTAVAISGAAASPNMGAQTPSLPLIFLLALANARLGFWAPSPGRGQWRESHATLWPYYLLKETLSQTTDVSTYCYLSDGGHFDNTGLYALVERGCRYIVLVDCGADPAPSFEDVGTAIRRCRIDFGTEFSFDVEKLRERSGDTLFLREVDDRISMRVRSVLARRQVLAGRIQYRRDHWEQLGLGSVSDEERLGVILWIKPVVVRANAVDVRQYDLQNPAFPQQTTLDQWFDEAQFESYRKLGYDSVISAVTPEAATIPAPPTLLRADQVQNFFLALWRRHR